MWTRNERKGIVFLFLIALIVAFAIIIIIQTSKVDIVSNVLDNNQVVRVLYILEDEEKDVLAMELVVYYPEAQRVIILNIPENTGKVYTSLDRTDSISAVYKEKGINTCIKELETILGVSIPFYVCFTPEQFSLSVDMIGGVRVFIPTPINSSDDSGNLFLLPSGSVLLDGEKVFAYLTYEDSLSSYDKSYERYQDVLLAYFEMLSKNKELVLHRNAFKLFAANQSTNLELDDFFTLVKQLSDVKIDYPIRLNIRGNSIRVDENLLLFPQSGGAVIRQSLGQATQMLLSETATTSRTYVIDIQNGTGVQGLARNTGILFQGTGYEILRTVNADRDDYEKTVIINNIGNEEVAKVLGKFIRCENIVTPEAETENQQNVNADFIIILGKDFDGRYVR
ncbi:MAG: LCP family protein [Treponema sp.]|nr:LCP family protein [Treponema sp.]